jgi:hypothetical protein
MLDPHTDIGIDKDICVSDKCWSFGSACLGQGSLIRHPHLNLTTRAAQCFRRLNMPLAN